MEIFLLITLVLLILIVFTLRGIKREIKNGIIDIQYNLSKIDNNLERFKKRFVPTKQDERIDEIKSSIGYEDDEDN